MELHWIHLKGRSNKNIIIYKMTLNNYKRVGRTSSVVHSPDSGNDLI